MLFLILNKALDPRLKTEKKYFIRFICFIVLFFITLIYDIIFNYVPFTFQVNLLIRPIFLVLYQYFIIEYII